MKNVVKWYDGLPKIVKIIFALPGLEILWNIYRLAKSIVKNNPFGIFLALILILIGWAFLWIIDIITIILHNKVIWID